MVNAAVKRGDVVLVGLGHGQGGEIRKKRPCLVVSPDELNVHTRTYIVAPMTGGGHPYPCRVPCRFQGRSGHVVLDQIRTIDRDRLGRRLGRISARTLEKSLGVLQEMFAS